MLPCLKTCPKASQGKNTKAWFSFLVRDYPAGSSLRAPFGTDFILSFDRITVHFLPLLNTPCFQAPQTGKQFLSGNLHLTASFLGHLNCNIWCLDCYQKVDTKMVFGNESLAAHLAKITSLVEDGTMIGPGTRKHANIYSFHPR